MITTTAFLIGDEEKTVDERLKGCSPINCHRPTRLKFALLSFDPSPDGVTLRSL